MRTQPTSAYKISEFIMYVENLQSNLSPLVCAYKSQQSCCLLTVDTFHPVVALDSSPTPPIAFWICLNTNTAAFSSEERKFTWMHNRWMCCRQSCVRQRVFFLLFGTILGIRPDYVAMMHVGWDKVTRLKVLLMFP